jgi:hypothetical protein
MGPDGIYRVVRPDAFVLDRFVPGMKTMATKRHINNQQKKEQVVTEQFLANEPSFIGEHSDGVITKASNHQLIYSLAGSGLGLACVVGGFTVDIAWEDGKVRSYRIASADPRQAEVRVNGQLKTILSEPE